MSLKIVAFQRDCYKEFKKLDGTQRQWAIKVLDRLRDPDIDIAQVLEPMGDRGDLELSGTYKAKNRATGMRLVIWETNADNLGEQEMVGTDGKILTREQTDEVSILLFSIAIGQKDDKKKVYKAAAKRYSELKDKK